MKVDFRFEHHLVKANTTTPIGLMIECTAPAAPIVASATVRASQGVVFVIDRSGSMGSGRLELVKQTILELLSRLNRNDFLSVVSFDDTPLVEVEMKRVSDHNMADVRRRISDMRPGGSTNLEMGYRTGIEQAALAGVETKIVLLSDGQANAGVVDPVLLGQLAARVTEHMISTSTIGIGTGYDERILDALAVASNGNHFAAVELGEAVDGLTAEFDDLLNKTAANLKVSVELSPRFAGAGASIRKITYLRKFTSRGALADAELGDMCSEEEKNFVFELNLGAADFTDGAPEKAARIFFEWIDLETNQLRSLQTELNVSVVKAEDYVEPARDEDVLAELATIRLQERKEFAIALMRDGRVAEAQALMAELGMEYERMLAEYVGMSSRSRSRMHSEMSDSMAFSLMHDDEFIKRGTESINRKRSSKPDPRKKGDV
jgi:Ca-activated chloride channel family protein